MKNNGMSMAWKEPGDSNKNDSHGGGNKDPWGNKNNDHEGPPDLDKVFQDISKKLKNMFGGGSGGKGSSFGGGGKGSGGNLKGSSSSGRGKFFGISFGMGAIFFILLVLYVASGFYIIKPAEQGVITRFGKFNRTVGQGPHWLPTLIESKRIINTEKIQSSSHVGTMLTKDENIVNVAMEVQYRIDDVENYLFSVADPDYTLRQAADSALRQVVGNANLEFVITTGKGQIAEGMKEQLRKILERYDVGIYVATVAFKEAKPPVAVKDAFDSVTKSREEREQLKHQAETYANQILPEARGQAQQMRVSADAYKESIVLEALGDTKRFNSILKEYKKAPTITKKRMYLDAIEKVLSKTSKILVDVNSGNNLIYLPVDKIMQRGASSSFDAKITSTSQDTASKIQANAKEDPPSPNVVERYRDRIRNRG